MINFLNPISDKDLRDIFKKSYSNGKIINNTLFHIKINELEKFECDPDKCFNVLKENFNQYNAILNSISLEYKKGSRIVIDSFEINYESILNTINIFKINNKQIPYIYEFLLKKLIKQIVYENITNDLPLISINILKNLLTIEYNNITKEYKLYKFIRKYQLLYPDKYKNYYVNLVISNDWKDILFQSTFKQWTSCTNILNSNVDSFFSNTPVEEIKNGDYIAYLVIHDNAKTIDDIMNDIGPESLSYEYCIWRSMIHRYKSECDDQFLYCPELTSYGIPSQARYSISLSNFSKNSKIF